MNDNEQRRTDYIHQLQRELLFWRWLATGLMVIIGILIIILGR